MRNLVCASIVTLSLCSAAHAQGMWQMNAAYQNQFNQAYAAAYRPYYYAPAYYPRYAPSYASYAPNYGYNSNASRSSFYQMQQTLEMQDLNRTLRQIEFNQRLAR